MENKIKWQKKSQFSQGKITLTLPWFYSSGLL